MDAVTIVSWVITAISAFAAYVSVQDARKSHNYVKKVQAVFNRDKLRDSLNFIDQAMDRCDDLLVAINPETCKQAENPGRVIAGKAKRVNKAIEDLRGSIPSEYKEKVEVEDSVYKTILAKLDSIVSGQLKGLKNRTDIVSEVKNMLQETRSNVDKLIKGETSLVTTGANPQE